jgi:hypothetical protein
MILEGMLTRVRRNAGSKSEHFGFEVRRRDGSAVVVEKEGDNPFEHESLVPLEHRLVRAVGEMYRGRFIADTIDPLD